MPKYIQYDTLTGKRTGSTHAPVETLPAGISEREFPAGLDESKWDVDPATGELIASQEEPAPPEG